jgi:phage shock protein A
VDGRTVLASLEEREKWTRRLARLESALGDVRLQREKLERRLRELRRQIAHFADIAEAGMDRTRRASIRGVTNAPTLAAIPRR